MGDFQPREPDPGSREDWDIIEAALGFKDIRPLARSALRNRLRVMVELYHAAWRTVQLHEVRSAHYKPGLRILRHHAASLRAYLAFQPQEPPPPLTELESFALGLFLADYVGMVPRRRRKALVNSLNELIGLIDHASRSLPADKGGRPRDTRLQAIIYHLADLYREHRGRGPGISWNDYEQQYRGPFLRLVKGVLKVFIPELRKDDNALAGDIRRVLKWWRKSRSRMNKTSDQSRRVLAFF
jgi:hypothetical protein